MKRRTVKVIASVMIASLIIAFSVYATVQKLNLTIFAIVGASMEPTLKNGDTVIVKGEEKLEIDQIAFFDRPDTWNLTGIETDVLVKRVVATPGDTLQFDGKAFLVNEEIVYELSQDSYDCETDEVGYEHTLRDNEVFVMGDNPLHSLDSRRIFCSIGSEHIYIPKDSLIDFGNIIFTL